MQVKLVILFVSSFVFMVVYGAEQPADSEQQLSQGLRNLQKRLDDHIRSIAPSENRILSQRMAQMAPNFNMNRMPHMVNRMSSLLPSQDDAAAAIAGSRKKRQIYHDGYYGYGHGGWDGYDGGWGHGGWEDEHW